MDEHDSLEKLIKYARSLGIVINQYDMTRSASPHRMYSETRFTMKGKFVPGLVVKKSKPSASLIHIGNF